MVRKAVVFVLACVGCTDPEARDACEAYCAERTACDEEKGDIPSDTCESSCLSEVDDTFIEAANACEGLTSCEYAVCLSDGL